MSEEACRTRSQKRALELDPVEDDADSKRMRMDRGPAGSEPTADGDTRTPLELGTGLAQGLRRPAEAEATPSQALLGDGPVDMRTSHSGLEPERRPASPDVIVLSDSEQPSSPAMNGLSTAAAHDTSTETLLKSSPETRETVIKQLREELRLEEAKLVLLKKLRQSQSQKEASAAQKPMGSSGSAVTTPPPLVRGTQNISASRASLQTSSTRVPGSVIPPPLVRGGQQVSAKLGAQTSSQVVMPPLVRGAQQTHSMRQHASSGPPPLLLAPRASAPSMQLQGQRVIQQGLIRVANVPSASLLVNISQPTAASLKGTPAASQATSTPSSVASVVASVESPASRQAAAKLALRKQLEKTLLEIPPPKPPAPEMNFLPSAANNEFIYLVGLEEVVQNLLETQAGRMPAAVLSREPYMCAQCKTDFTCRWREEKGGAVMCESCMTSSQKKALKVEHTSRLKAAFVKALQQEQEMEQRLLQGPSAPPSGKAEPTPHPALKQVIKPRRKLAFRSGEARDWSNGAVLQVRTGLGLPTQAGCSGAGYHCDLSLPLPFPLSLVEFTGCLILDSRDPSGWDAVSQMRRGRSRQRSRSPPPPHDPSLLSQASSQLSRGSATTPRGILHTFSQSSKLQTTTSATALVSRTGRHSERAAGTGKGAAPSWKKSAGGTLAFVSPGLAVHKTTSAVDRQREYLLDMIPPRSVPQSATWK